MNIILLCILIVYSDRVFSAPSHTPTPTRTHHMTALWHTAHALHSIATFSGMAPHICPYMAESSVSDTCHFSGCKGLPHPSEFSRSMQLPCSCGNHTDLTSDFKVLAALAHGIYTLAASCLLYALFLPQSMIEEEG